MNWEPKLVAFGADGASVNLGKKAGLAALLRKELPYLVDFHCLPQWFELALLELQKSCKLVDDIYNGAPSHLENVPLQPKSVRALKSIADELQINILKPTQGTRWLPHVSRALNVFVGSPAKPTSESGQYSIMLTHCRRLTRIS